MSALPSSQDFFVRVSVSMCNDCLDNPEYDQSQFPNVYFFVDFEEFTGTAVFPNKTISLVGKAAYTEENSTYPEIALNSLQERISSTMNQLLNQRNGDIEKASEFLAIKELQSNEYLPEKIVFEISP